MGSVVLSLDAELAWGFHAFDDPPAGNVAAARPAWLRLVDLFDEYETPATWAVVGHLFLEECDGVHADHPTGREWFADDPGRSRAVAESWYGPDLIDAVRTAAVDHDIGCHSFSHVEFGAPETTREAAAAELDASVQLADTAGLSLDSFVFPRNNVGHRDLLREFDFTTYRGQSPARWFDDAPGRPVWKLVDVVGGRPAPLVEPTVDEYGLVNVPASIHLFTFEGPVRRVTGPLVEFPIVESIRASLDRLADRNDGILHVWFHPHEMKNAARVERVRELLETIADYRDRGAVTVETMADVAERTH